MRKWTGMLALATVFAFGVVGPVNAEKGGKGDGGEANHGPKGYEDGDGTQTQPCNSDGTHSISYVGPTRLWPPNHRDVEGVVTATGHETDEVTLIVTGTDNDTGEESDFAGGGDIGTGSATTEISFVRERTGQAKAGRTYTIRADATFSDSTTTCTKYFCVIVPHDMRKENRTVDCTPDTTF